MPGVLEVLLGAGVLAVEVLKVRDRVLEVLEVQVGAGGAGGAGGEGALEVLEVELRAGERVE